MEDSGAQGDYVLDAAGPSDRIPFRASEEGPHYLWVYQELFTRLRMRLPFSDFQRDVMTRCRVAVSQPHLNGWGFILAFEKVCLHYGFRPTTRLFFYIYDVHFPPGGYGYISFRARQGQRLFDSYEDSIQEFKWPYFKVLAAPGKRAFWLDHESKPFSWVYWNPEVKDFTVYNLEPLEMAALKFLVSLPGGLLKMNKFTCRWILDGSDAEVGKFLAAAATSASAAAGPTLARSSSQVPPVLTASETHRSKKQSPKRDRAKVVNLEDEEGLQEDPAADLQKKRRRKKVKVDEAFEKALGMTPLGSMKSILSRLLFRRVLTFGRPLMRGSSYEDASGVASWRVLPSSCQISCLSPVGVETSLAAKVKAEKELLASLDQIEILKGEMVSALSYLPFKEKADTLKDELSEKSLEHQSALDRIAQLEEDNMVLKTQFESSQLSLEADRKRAAAAEGQVGSLAASLKTCQADLSKATEASEYWHSEWQTLGTEGRRIFVPQESDEGEPSRITEVVPEQPPEPIVQATPSATGDAAEVGGGCPT
ncbi:hypothetical protein PIB30_025411 [Stylosanthes scabra]|uniref:Uncharacterized protein n=1 Tax=Stylosanthes scabra TaxID=79078 RepID=A0ABU6RAL2_9FABA|nr:hypothetical protein [Stylosanthes scabra]